jgi:hypothetical protein
MPTQIQAALATLETTPRLLRQVLDALPALLPGGISDGGWSPKHVVAHLILSERSGAIARIRAIVTSDHPLLENRDENAELSQFFQRDWDLRELCGEFTHLRADDVAWLRTVDVTALARRGRHSAVGDVTAEEMLCHAAYHDLLHVRQVLGMLQGEFEPLRGAMRAF